ncbi:MAG: hypothetical protein ACE366_21160 [Bradymonadia bacterium]
MPHPMLTRILTAMAGGGVMLAGCIADPQGLEDAEVPLPDGTMRFAEDADLTQDARVEPPPLPDMMVPDGEPPVSTVDATVDVDAETPPPPPVMGSYVCESDWAECYDPPPGEPCPDLANDHSYETMVSVLDALGYQDDGCLWAWGPCNPEGMPARCCYEVDFGCEGRPFHVEAEMRKAAPTHRTDWV